MTPKRILLVGALLVGLAGLTALSQEGPDKPVGLRMAAAAEKLLDSLSAEQKAKAAFAFDDKERTNWNFVPLQDKDKKPTRKGLRMDQMKDEQRQLALDLLKAGTSTSGYGKATTIMSLEAILRELEKGGAMVRDPGWYFVSLFGTPSKTGKWGWRIEGHHLSLNFTVDKGKVLSATPAFFGANPAKVRDGDKKGLRTLPESEDFARDLFASLDVDQQKVALQPKQFGEPQAGKPAPDVGKPVGLAAAKMTNDQRDLLQNLIRGYTERMPPEVATAQREEVRKAGLEAVHFAFAQDKDKPGQPYTYRVQGPTFVIEFLNVQADSAGNPANHIHSCWRNLAGDFGLERP
jgi:hypothetical protein